jgi:hypothetical protein
MQQLKDCEVLHSIFGGFVLSWFLDHMEISARVEAAYCGNQRTSMITL